MDHSNDNQINDVMSGEDANSQNHSNSDSTIVSPHDDGILSSILGESELIVKSLSNLYSYKNDILDEKKYERKPWQSSLSLKSKPTMYNNDHSRPSGTSGYSSGDLGIPSISNGPLINRYPCDVQMFSDTSGLMNTLQNELTKRTTELHNIENEYFNLKASYENMSYQFDMANTDQSSLRSQITMKDRQIKQLQQKVNSLEGNFIRSSEEYEVIRTELERTRDKLDEVKQVNDCKNESLSGEIKQREEVIDQLRNELMQTARNIINKPNDKENLCKEKNVQLEKTIKQKDQQIQELNRKNNELQILIKTVQEANQENIKKYCTFDQLEEEIEFLKERFENANQKNESLNDTLTNSKKFYDEFKIQSENNTKSHLNTIDKLKQDCKELEKKSKDSLTSLKEQREANKTLINEIKLLTDKINYSESNQIEQNKKIHLLSLENAEITQKLEHFKVQLVEATITETNLNKSFKNESDSKQNYIEQLSQETIHLNRTIDDLKDKIRVRDTTIEKLNEELVKLNEMRDNEKRMIKCLEDKTSQMSYNENVLESNLQDKTREIEITNIEIESIRKQNETSAEEIRKILAEKRDLERALKRKEETYNQEMIEKEEMMQSNKSELQKLNFLLTNEKDINQRLMMENDKYMQDLTTLKMRSNEYCEDLEEKKTYLDELMEKEKRLQHHNQFLEEELSQIKLALEDSSQELEHIKNTWNLREDALESCKKEALKQQENNLNLIQKIEQRDQLLQRLTSETSKLKQKYQGKSIENSKLNKDNESLKMNLVECENSLKEWPTKLESLSRKKESIIEQLKTQLTDSQTQYSQCYETLLKKEEYLNRFQLSEKDYSLKFSDAQKEISHLQLDYDEMESELNMIRAKHRACQEELNHRDERLLEMKNELQLQQQDNFESQSERLLCQQEMDRYKLKISDLQNKLQSQINETEMFEDKLSEKDQIYDEILGKLQISNQKNENQDRIIEQLKTDISLCKSTNNDRNVHYQSIITSLKNELETRHQENQMLEEKCGNYKSQIGKLKIEEESLRQNILAMKGEVEAVNVNVKIKESECQHWMKQSQNAQYLQEEMKVSLDSMEKEINFSKQQLEVKEAKLYSNSENITKLKNERNNNYKNLLDCKNQIESLTKDRDEMEKLYEDNNIKMRKYEECMKDLNEELSIVQVEICNYTTRISTMETELNRSVMENSRRQELIDEMTKKITKLKGKFNNYKSQYKTSDIEVETLNSLLLEQTRKTGDQENMIYVIRTDIEKLSNDKTTSQQRIIQLINEIELKNKEVEQLSISRDEKTKGLEESLRKYQSDMKKMKTYGKQVEEDISISHKTIDDLNNQLEYKQEQLDVMNKKCESLEDYLDRRNREVNQLEIKLTTLETEFKLYRNHQEIDCEKQRNLYKEIDILQMEIKDKDNKILQITTENTKYQTKCQNLENNLEKSEKKLLKYESECKVLRSSFCGYNKEMTELRSQQHNQSDILEKTKSQYEKFFNDFNVLKEEIKKEKKLNLSLSNEIETLNMQQTRRVEHQRLLEDQIEEHEKLITELQNEIIQERKKNEDLQRNEFQKRRTIHDIENETEVLSQMKQDLQIKLRDKDQISKSHYQEMECLNKKIRQSTESSMEKENKLKIVEKRLQMSENEITKLRAHITKMESLNDPSDILSDRSEYILQLQTTMDSNQDQIDQLRSQNRQLIITCQNKDEEIQRIKKEYDILQLKYSEFTSSNDYASTSIKRKSQIIEEENENLKRSIRQLRCELEERDKLLLQNHDESLNHLTRRLTKLQNQEIEYENQIRRLMSEVDYQKEQTNVTTAKYDVVYSEKDSLRMELQRSIEAISVLKKEKESIVDNFNSWIQEQKLANEKLGEKIRDQNKVIHELRKDRKEGGKTINYSKTSTPEYGGQLSISDIEKLREKLNINERQFELHIREKDEIIEELHNKVKSQVKEIGNLKEQIVSFQKNQVEHDGPFADSYRKENGDQFDSEIENGSLDKQYWIKRVGELSEELQQTKQYWSNKVKEISNNVESSIITDESESILPST